MLKAIAAAGMLHLDLRRMEELTPTMYEDDVHLEQSASPMTRGNSPKNWPSYGNQDNQNIHIPYRVDLHTNLQLRFCSNEGFVSAVGGHRDISNAQYLVAAIASCFALSAGADTLLVVGQIPGFGRDATTISQLQQFGHTVTVAKDSCEHCGECKRKDWW